MIISSELLKDLNVLIVDDDKISVEIISRHLSDVFKMVDVAYDGVMGLSTFLKNNYDIVITDLYMPEMDGIGLISQIRKLDSEIPIVVVTAGDGDIDQLKELLNLGVSRFLQKPFSKNVLVSTITDACSKVILSRRLLKEKEMEIELLKYREIYNVNQQKAAYRKEVNLLLNDLAKKKVSNGRVEYLFNSFYKPVEILCGDIYSYRFVSNDIIFGFILDTMGKGLSAAVTSVLSVAFLNHSVDRAMEHNDFDFIKTSESFLNYIKKILLDEEMLCASFFIIDTKKDLLSYIHCGMPSIMIKNLDGNLVELDSNNPPINKYTSKLFSHEYNLSDVDSMIIYSDGLVESYTQKRKLYANEIKFDFLASTFYTDFEKVFTEKMPSLLDDLTIFYLKRLRMNKIWEINSEISTKLDEVNSFLEDVEMQLNRKGLNDDLISKIKVSAYELLMNAYEHGNLGIDMEQKHRLIKNNLYDKYLKENEKDCKKTIKIKYGIYMVDGVEVFGFSVTDEGEGFSINISNRALENTEYYCGRGIVLSNLFANALHYNIKGNESSCYIITKR